MFSNIDGSSVALHERSFSRNNIPMSMRRPSKAGLVQNIRSASISSTGSVVHNTCERNENTSPSKGYTPEWKRRLIQGQLDAGEQPDLFTGARTDLEAMFQPPSPLSTQAAANRGQIRSPQLHGHYTMHRNETSFPSSPPSYAVDRDNDMGSQELEESPSVIRQRTMSTQKPRQMRYRMVDPQEYSRNNSIQADKGAQEASKPELRDPSSFSETPLSTLSKGTASSSMIVPTSAPQPPDPARQVSSQSVVQNEALSPILMSPTKDQYGRIIFAPVTEVPAAQLKSKLESLRRSQKFLDATIRESDLEQGNSESTQELVQLGAFINCQRGGRSAEGSFRHRMLSPCDTSDMLPEDSLQASTPKQFPSLRQDTFSKSPVLPSAPYPSPERTGRCRELLRPIPTFSAPLVPSLRPFSQHTSSTEVDSALRLDSEGPQTPRSDDYPKISSNKFGSGKLNGYTFHEEVSYHSYSDESKFGTISKESISAGNKAATKFDLSVLSKYDLSTASAGDSKLLVDAVAKKFEPDSESKRPRSSPSKGPTPKRRRTLHESDVAYGTEHGPNSRTSSLESVQQLTQRMQPALGKKRKDRLLVAPQLAAAPHILASRSILRPRNPTPRASEYCGSQAVFDHVDVNESQFGDDSVVSDASASFAAPARTPRSTTARKPSIKTQDFLDEAEKIMAMIRNKARPVGLSSVEESEAENQSSKLEQYDSFEESSVEPLSRPPSRDGHPIPRNLAKQDDPELILRLKKYEEQSEIDDVMSSLRSLGMARDDTTEGEEIQSQFDGRIQEVKSKPIMEEIVDSDLNVHIVPNPLLQSHGPRFPAECSHGSSQTSNRSTSSKNSESWKTIPPQNVSHLIPDQVGNMVFDRQQYMWVKQKHFARLASPRNILLSEDSEDDPFASIPDLTVDLTTEMRNLKLSTAQKPSVSQQPITGTDSKAVTPTRIPRPSSSTLKSSLKRTKMRASAHTDQFPIHNNETLLENDREMEYEFTLHENRIKTSPPRKTISFSSPIASIIREVVKGDSDEKDKEKSSERVLLENLKSKSVDQAWVRSRSSIPRPKGTPTGSKCNISRHVSAVGPPFVPHPVSRIDEQDENNTSALEGLVIPDEQSVLIPNQELDEFDCDEAEEVIGTNEESALVPADKADASISFLVTPAAARTVSCPVPSNNGPVIGQYVGTLSLSPLSEFTLNNYEQSMGLEFSYVVADHRLYTGSGSKRTMTLAVKNLVNRIAEVVPFEPDWEELQELSLAKKSLSSLHKLDEFCGGLVTLDASNNALSQLDGVPHGMRHLKITHNQLSELTGWGHLTNLQYIDVSNNELKSLSALRSLVHLRDIKADNNKITSISDLIFHDGIQRLRARGNLIEELDFEGTTMHHLVDLDLKNNQITTAQHIEALTNLSSLNLEHNRLQWFKTKKNKKYRSLKYLTLSDNDIVNLDVSSFPSLRVLHADRNNIETITGFANTRHLDSLSLREQKQGTLDLKFLSHCYEVRKLFLSGNFLVNFKLTFDFLNLQYLEIANCGMEALPENIGQLCPNLRVVNANFNAINDLRPLREIPRLKKLLLAGNRLEMRKERVVDVLTQMPHLKTLDLRGNPLTLGFYHPLQLATQLTVSAATDSYKTTETANESGSFELSASDGDKDAKFSKRLDIQTRMRRRIYEVLIIGSCERLKNLDGLSISRSEDKTGDNIWQRLKERGLIVEKESPFALKDAIHQTPSSSSLHNNNIPRKTIRTFGIIQENGEELLEMIASNEAWRYSSRASSRPPMAATIQPQANGISCINHAIKADESSRWAVEDSFAG